MSTDRDVTRIVRSWMDEGVTALPDRVLDAVLDQLPATPQRRASWLAWRSSPMKSSLRIVLAAAVVVVAAVIGFQFLRGPSTGGPGPSSTPTSSTVPSPTPSPTPAAFPPPGSMAIGRHSMILSGAKVSVEIPTAGWRSNGQWGLDKGDMSAPASANFIFWPASAPDNVYADPCAETLLSPPPGTSAAELAAAVSKVAGTDLVSGPSQVTLGGYPAQHVVIKVPDSIGCAADKFYLWEDKDTPGAARYASQVGETIYVWIVDVNGTIVWIDGETYATSSAEAVQEVHGIVDSIRFE